jgi:hypothetical protein
MGAFYAITDIGPYRSHQVVLFEDGNGWLGTGYFIRLVESSPQRLARTDADGHLLIPVVLRD